MKLPDRIASRINKQPDGCWLWTGYLMPGGYGKARIDGKQTTAHRAVYLQVVGPVPDGYHLDHLCRVKSCVNPDHLEPVTPRVNILRGESPAAANHLKSECKRGHPLGDGDVHIDTKGKRVCRICKRFNWNRRAAEKRAALEPQQESDTE